MSRDALAHILALTSLMSADMQRGLMGLDLTEARAHVLWELGKMDPPTQRHLAEVLRVTPRNVTALVDVLEASGHLCRTPCPGDRRAVLVVLTAKGRNTVAQLKADFAVLAKRLFSDVTEDDLAVFARVLQEVAERLRVLPQAENSLV
jgi:DNA-binding MarR family transcriptional regulator